MNKDVSIKNMCNKSITIHYHQRWGSNFVLGASKAVPPQETASLEKLSMRDRLIAVMIPGFETAKDIPIKNASSIIIKPENKKEVIIVQGFHQLASMKALTTSVWKISLQEKP